MPTIIHNNIAFIHIPKTGGCSICMLTPNTRYLINDLQSIITDEDAYLLLHAPANLIKKHFGNIRMVAYVRNPYTRFISMFCMSKSLCIHKYAITIEGITQFCNNFNTTPVLKDANIFKPMVYYTHDENGCIVDDILRFEDFANETSKYARIMNIEPPVEIPDINKNCFIQNETYDSWYESCPMLFTFVNEVYKEDFAAFNYEMKTHIQ